MLLFDIQDQVKVTIKLRICKLLQKAQRVDDFEDDEEDHHLLVILPERGL